MQPAGRALTGSRSRPAGSLRCGRRRRGFPGAPVAGGKEAAQGRQGGPAGERGEAARSGRQSAAEHRWRLPAGQRGSHKRKQQSKPGASPLRNASPIRREPGCRVHALRQPGGSGQSGPRAASARPTARRPLLVWCRPSRRRPGGGPHLNKCEGHKAVGAGHMKVHKRRMLPGGAANAALHLHPRLLHACTPGPARSWRCVSRMGCWPTGRSEACKPAPRRRPPPRAMLLSPRSTGSCASPALVPSLSRGAGCVAF